MVWLVVSLVIQDQDLVMAGSGAFAGALGWFAVALVIGAQVTAGSEDIGWGEVSAWTAPIGHPATHSVAKRVRSSFSASVRSIQLGSSPV